VSVASAVSTGREGWTTTAIRWNPDSAVTAAG